MTYSHVQQTSSSQGQRSKVKKKHLNGKLLSVYKYIYSGKLKPLIAYLILRQ